MRLRMKCWILLKYCSNLKNQFPFLSSPRCVDCLLILKTEGKLCFVCWITLETKQIVTLEVATRITKQTRNLKLHLLQHLQLLVFRSRISWITIPSWKSNWIRFETVKVRNMLCSVYVVHLGTILYQWFTRLHWKFSIL